MKVLVLSQGAQLIPYRPTLAAVLNICWPLATLSPFLKKILGDTEDDGGIVNLEHRVIIDDRKRLARFQASIVF